MVAAIGAGLEYYRQVLALRGYRQEILSADIANASTPGFKAVDLDFAAALKSAGEGSSGGAVSPPPARLWLVDDARQMQPAASRGVGGASSVIANFVKYQADSEVTLDGNSVDLDHEKVMTAENAVQYQAAATFATQSVHMLMTAITGSASGQTGG
jgi:flagellar basal-body rod protein FlgB